MLEFSDAPYQFFPAKPSRLVQRICERANRHLVLPGPNHLVKGMEINGGEGLRELAASGTRILMVANHPSHSDPQVMTEVHRRLGLRSCFMAAYDVFLRGSCRAWMMQRNGAFSIDREGSDKQSMKEALRILKEGRYALTIFPEGNVYLNNDRVTPFMEGAAYVALRAQKELGMEQPVYAVPISLKMTYAEDVGDKMERRMDEVARLAGVEPNRCGNPLDELREIGRKLLEQRMEECGHAPGGREGKAGDWRRQFEGCAEKLIAGLEGRMDLDSKPGQDLTDRIRRIRAAIHRIRTRGGRAMDAGENRQAKAWADEAILAFRTLTYAKPYVAEHPTLDRFVETVEKMGEDYTGKARRPLGARVSLVRIGGAMNLAECLGQHSGKLRQAVAAVNSALENAVQAGVDRLNVDNRHAGGQVF